MPSADDDSSNAHACDKMGGVNEALADDSSCVVDIDLAPNENSRRLMAEERKLVQQNGCSGMTNDVLQV